MCIPTTDVLHSYMLLWKRAEAAQRHSLHSLHSRWARQLWELLSAESSLPSSPTVQTPPTSQWPVAWNWAIWAMCIASQVNGRGAIMKSSNLVDVGGITMIGLKNLPKFLWRMYRLQYCMIINHHKSYHTTYYHCALACRHCPGLPSLRRWTGAWSASEVSSLGILGVHPCPTRRSMPFLQMM